MKRLAAVFMLVGVLLAAPGAASAKGEPQGPHVQDWPCFLDLGTWHCVSPGVLKNFGRVPSGPSLNWECDDPADPLCEGLAFSEGPPEGTHFVGTENLIRADLYAGQPCPRGTSGFVDLGVAVYWFCHHYPPSG